MPFSLDTSGLLDAWVRHYPVDVFPTIWSHMELAAKNGEILVIDEVVLELKRKDDGIYTWIEVQEAMVVPIDKEVQQHLSDVMGKYPRLVDTRKNRSGCDPWVIALAQARSLTVVTGEKSTGSLVRPKIPDVCKDLGIPCISVIDFFRKQGWRL